MSTEANAINLSTVGIVGNTGTSFTATSATEHNVIVGGSTTSTLANIAPSATSGIPLVSNGSSADPSFSTALVAGGGTGSVTFNTNGAVISGSTSTSALTSLSLTDGQVVIGSSVGAPAAATISAGSGISVSNSNNSITISATGTTTFNVTSVTHLASPYTVLTTDDYLACQTSGGTITIELPNSPATGRAWIIKDSNGAAATSNITVTTVGGTVTIDGSTSQILSANYQSINVIFDGTNYEIY